eukprot:scaffold29050_cov112-Isochrysis_galbana.AAC.6
MEGQTARCRNRSLEPPRAMCCALLSCLKLLSDVVSVSVFIQFFMLRFFSLLCGVWLCGC